MDRVVWESRPHLQRPVAVVAFEGWGDAGAVSSGTVDALAEWLGLERIAYIDSDDYFDFQAQRPLIRIDETGSRVVDWPETEIWAGSLSGSDRDLLIVTGHEPHTRWRGFSREVISVLGSLGCSQILTLGAFAGEVPHTLPVPLIGSANRPGVVERHQLMSSSYQGPTGIIGVLNHGLAESGADVLSIWAAVPHYLAGQAYPPGMLVMAEKVAEILEISIDVAELEDEVTEFRRDIEEAMNDAELRAYVEDLEAETLSDHEEVEAGGQLVEEIERFLRES